ncbi:MAG: threonine synthase [Vicinamibacterales bacterium]
MPHRAVFRCSDGCAGDIPLDTVVYHCPTCGGLLDVVHDVPTLAATSARRWMSLFDARYTARADRLSGVWSKREWVCPEVADADIVSLDEGHSSLVAFPALARDAGVADVRIKQCGQSPTGSFKDLGMTVLVSMVATMMRRGRPVRGVACASTGDTSAALAAYAAVAGVPAIVLLPRGLVSTAQLVQPLAHGAHVLSLDTDFDGCMALVQRLAREEGVYLANSMNSLRLEGQKTVAFEIVQQLGWDVPDAIVVPGGNLGNVSALGAGLTLMERLGVITRRPRLIVAQAEAANPLYRAASANWRLEPMTAGPTQATAIRIGHPVSFARAVRALTRFDGWVEQATESELADAAARADSVGAFACPQTAVALAVLLKLGATGRLRTTDRVVVVSTASGLKFVDTKVAYHEGRLAGVASTRRNVPIELPADYDAVRRTVDRVVGP